VLRDGVFSTIVFPQSPGFTDLEAINNDGQILGLYVDANSNLQSFIFDGESFRTINVPFPNILVDLPS
jgi:hypothetical protein